MLRQDHQVALVHQQMEQSVSLALILFSLGVSLACHLHITCVLCVVLMSGGASPFRHQQITSTVCLHSTFLVSHYAQLDCDQPVPYWHTIILHPEISNKYRATLHYAIYGVNTTYLLYVNVSNCVLRFKPRYPAGPNELNYIPQIH